MDDNSNRRRVYYINKDFQFNFILKFCLLILAGSAISGAIIYLVSKATVTTSFDNLRLVIKSTADFMMPAILLSSAIVVVITGAATVFITLFTSHKIAGPLYRIEKDIDVVASGDLTKEFNLRQGDEVRPIAEALNEMTGNLRLEIDLIKKSIDEIDALASGGNAPAELKGKIKELKADIAKIKT